MSEGHSSQEIRRRVRVFGGDRCSYCLSPQHLVYGMLEIVHGHRPSDSGTVQ